MDNTRTSCLFLLITATILVFCSGVARPHSFPLNSGGKAIDPQHFADRLSHTTAARTPIAGRERIPQNNAGFADGWMLVHALTQDWSDTGWVNIVQVTSTYIAADREITNFAQRWDSSWVNTSIDSVWLDENDRMKVSRELVWRGGSWINSALVTAGYDAAGNDTLLLIQDWDTTLGSWINFIYLATIYDTGGHEISFQEGMWVGSSWIIVRQIDRTYNRFGEQTRAVEQDWNGTALANAVFDSTAYDSSGREIAHLLMTWDGTAWAYTLRTATVYDTLDLVSVVTGQSWNDTSWVNSLRDSVTRDGRGRVINVIAQQWRDTVWVYTGRRSTTYDADNRAIAHLELVWSDTAWVNSYRDTTEFDAHGHEVHYLEQRWSHGAWVNSKQYIDTWQQVTAVNERPALADHFRLSNNYPNPFNSSTSISFIIPNQTHVVLRVYNLLGQMVTTLVDGEKPPGRYSVRWDAGSFPSGMYFYRIEAGRYVETKKMVLLR